MMILIMSSFISFFTILQNEKFIDKVKKLTAFNVFFSKMNVSISPTSSSNNQISQVFRFQLLVGAVVTHSGQVPKTFP